MTSSQMLSYRADVGEHGEFYLDITIRGARTSAHGIVLDVLALHELERFTQSLEDTFVHSLDWYRCFEEKPQTPLLELIVEFSHESLLIQAALMLPVSVIWPLAQWKIADANHVMGMFWKPVRCTLLLSRFQLSTAELAELEVGALVIIPESFQTTWSTTLRIADSVQSLQGEYQWPENCWLRQTEVAVKHSATVDCVDASISEATDTASFRHGKHMFSVQLNCQLDPAVLMQPLTSDDPVLHELHTRWQGESDLWLQNEVGVRFQGQLLELGAGQALLLQKKLSVVQ